MTTPVPKPGGDEPRVDPAPAAHPASQPTPPLASRPAAPPPASARQSSAQSAASATPRSQGSATRPQRPRPKPRTSEPGGLAQALLLITYLLAFLVCGVIAIWRIGNPSPAPAPPPATVAPSTAASTPTAGGVRPGPSVAPTTDASRSTPPPSPASTGAAPPEGSGNVRAFDPVADGGDGQENSADASLATDGDRLTGWRTERYGTSANFNGRKPGAGLVVDLGSVQTVSKVHLLLGAGGTDVQVRIPAGATPSYRTVDDWRVVASVSDVSFEATLTTETPVTTRYVLVYLTRMPPLWPGALWQGVIKEVSVSP